MTTVDLLYVRAEGQGWGPIDELATLSAHLLGAHLTTVTDRGEVSLARKLAGQAPRRRGRGHSLLVLASTPGHLAYAARHRHWSPGYTTTAAWVIDSFWTDRISRMALRRGHFDHIFITDRDLVDEWRVATGAAVHWAPWGTDTLAVGRIHSNRPVDLVRIGRQPPAWDDDDTIISAAREIGMVVQGRPPMHSDPRANQDAVRMALGKAKFVLAFSNLVSPASYTHPTREYLTGRWTDALGSGATVAGVAPVSAEYTLWAGATVPIDPTNLSTGLRQLRHAVDSWEPQVAVDQREHARASLDWRYRLVDIASALGLEDLDVLDRELELLRSSTSS